jgi:amino acid transporter
MSVKTFMNNTLWDFSKDTVIPANTSIPGDTGSTIQGQSFLSVFIICFPAVTGIMAGANYSGNLIDPGKSVGPGTLKAIIIAVTIYLLLALTMGASIDRETLKSDK